MMNSKIDLYTYLKTECKDLKTAKLWIYDWLRNKGQILPWDKEPEYTIRCMAGHVSNVLEGETEITGYAELNKSYLDTKYGPELYWAACGQFS